MALVPFPGAQSGALQREPDDDDDELAGAGGRMSFLEHLDELRKRIIHALLGILAGVAISIFWIGAIFDFLLAPAKSVLPAGSTLIYTQPGEAFSLYVTVSLISGTVVAAPFIMFQVWRFIAPGLYANEKRFAVPFVLLSSGGFLAGAAFNHYIAFPFIMAFFATFNTIDLKFLPKLSDVFGMYTKMLIGLGIVFQMPTLIFFLAKMQMVSARFLAGKFRFAMLIFVVLAAIITPTSDPVNLMIFTAPMIALYGFSIAIAWIVGPRGRSRAAGNGHDS
jgi:sec-independent protein translocase protein TatC